MKPTKISVIIPVYNTEKYLAEAIQSVLNQSLKPTEIIIVDDGSTDGSVSVVKTFGDKVNLLLQPKNMGCGVARNRGIAEAQGEYLAFLDADDFWPENKLEIQLAYLQSHPEADMVFGMTEQFISPELPTEHQSKLRGELKKMPGYLAGPMLIKKETFVKVGLFNEKLELGEFIDWFSRAKDMGLSFHLLDSTVLFRRIHTTNMGIYKKQHLKDYTTLLRDALARKRQANAQKTSKPVISIVLLSLLRQAETKLCIDSILIHTHIPFEIIIVDMGMSDEIVEWLHHLSNNTDNIRVIFNDRNVGTTKGRNQGIEISQGDYLVFLDNDTEVCPGWIEPLIQKAESSQKIAACGSKVISASGKVMNCAEFATAKYVDGKLIEIGVEFTADFQRDDPNVNNCVEVPWFPTTCLLVKKSVLNKIGPFDENIFLCEEDKDLCLQMTKAEMKIFYVPESIVYHHHKATTDDYAKIRNKLPVLIKDTRYFEKKWSCKVFIKHSRTYLHKSGINDQEIDRIKKFSFLNTIIEEELKLNELILTVTSSCNHRCGMCYYHENLNKQSSELTLEEYQKISASLGELNVLWISGGEPFLRRDLAEICRIFVKNNHVKNIFIPTNGSQTDKMLKVIDQILKQNPEVKLSIMFSLEGTKSLHDEVHGKTDAFEMVEKSIKKLNFLRINYFKQKRSFSILLNSVVSTHNINKMIPLMEYAKTHLMIDSHSLSPMRGQGRNDSYQPPSGEDFLILYEKAKPFFDFYAQKSKLSQEKKQQFHNWMQRRYKLWGSILEGGKLPFDCQAGNLIGVLEPDGGLRICESMPVAANVRNFNYIFPKAWFSLKANQTRDRVKNCSCTHACFLNVSENYAPKKTTYGN